jgi:hypothetical protein
MARFSDPELCLINQWADALLLESSMKTTRKKYETLFDEVLDRVQKKHPDLTELDAFIHRGHGVGIGKSRWRTNPKSYVSGFWIDANSLVNLVSDDEEMPISRFSSMVLTRNLICLKLKDDFRKGPRSLSTSRNLFLGLWRRVISRSNFGVGLTRHAKNCCRCS